MVFLLSIAGGVLSSFLFPGREVTIEIDENTKSTGVAEADGLIEQGKIYMNQLAEIESNIYSPEMRQRIAKLQDISRKIYSFLLDHPDQEKEIRMFSHYYMPTTIQTLKTYQDLEKSDPEYRGENVNGTMKRIDEAMETFSAAYENLLDALYKNKTMDVQADITVLQQMMEREGLVENYPESKAQ